MNPSSVLPETLAKLPRFQRPDPDRIGVVASILCAIHCAVTPFLLLFAPAFGKVWSHPASHWLVALLVVPLAAVMVRQGFRRHRRVWILGSGVLGISLVVAGAAIPYLGPGNTAETPESTDQGALHDSADPSAEEEEFVYVVGEEEEEEEPGEAAPAPCADACCPSLATDENGKLRLHLPLASLVTTLGGLALIATHLGNLCCCRNCKMKPGSPLLP